MDVIANKWMSEQQNSECISLGWLTCIWGCWSWPHGRFEMCSLCTNKAWVTKLEWKLLFIFHWRYKYKYCTHISIRALKDHITAHMYAYAMALYESSSLVSCILYMYKYTLIAASLVSTWNSAKKRVLGVPLFKALSFGLSHTFHYM